MGSYRAAALVVFAYALAPVLPATGQAPGWHYSPLPGEGDRASQGCTRGSTSTDFTCLAVRCEDDYSTGLYVYSSRLGGDAGRWEMTLDRERRQMAAQVDSGVYGARLDDPEGWLLDGLRHGSFVYLRHADDEQGAFAFLDLSGSYRSITEALQWCAPRLPPVEQIGEPGAESKTAD